MSSTFQGFPPALFEFLTELRSNNNREWFNENKERYLEDVAQPVTDFIESIANALEKISPHYVADARRHGGSMFRIYRDTRFSKIKLPYKTHVGCQFRHRAGKDAHAPGFYLHLAPEEVFFGGGIWKPDGSTLSAIRNKIVDDSASWKRITKNKRFLEHFGEIKGDTLKRPPRGFEATHPLIEDLKKKSFFILHDSNDEHACSASFRKDVLDSYRSASPFMKFLTEAVQLPY